MGVICGHKRKLEDLPARPRQFNGLSASTLRGEWRPEWHKTFESPALCRRVVRRLRDHSPIVFALFPFSFSARCRDFPASGKRRSSPHRAARFQSQSRNRAKGFCGRPWNRNWDQKALLTIRDELGRLIRYVGWKFWAASASEG